MANPTNQHLRLLAEAVLKLASLVLVDARGARVRTEIEEAAQQVLDETNKGRER